jgi:hypothetical protein
MGKAIEVLTGFATAPSTTFTALTMAAGNSRTIRNFEPGARAYLLAAWADVQGAGQLRIRSPFIHDNVQGIRLDTVAARVLPLLPVGLKQPLQPQDELILELTGSATAGDIEQASLLIYYEDLPGADAQLFHADDIMGRVKHIVTVENTLATGTAGGYSGEEALDAEFDLLRAGKSYAVLGGYVDVEGCVIRYRGADLSNFGVGFPAEPDNAELTSGFFLDLSRKTDLPTVPVINASNKSGFLIDAAQDENGADITVTTILAELA